MRLPEGKDLDGVLEVAAKESTSKLRRKDSAQMASEEDEVEVGSLLQPNSSLQKSTKLPRCSVGESRYWREDFGRGDGSLGKERVGNPSQAKNGRHQLFRCIPPHPAGAKFKYS